MPGIASLLYSNIPEDDYPEYSSGTTYGINAIVMVLTGTYKHKLFQSLVVGNLGNPVSDTTKWLNLGSTNRWKMHDASLQTQTTSSNGTIHNQYRVNGICTGIAALNIFATAMRVRVFDEFDGIVYDRSQTLAPSTAVTNWYEYFFTPAPSFVPDAFFLDLPPYANALVEIILSSDVGGVACGALVMGEVVEIGGTQYGAKVGIIDYSTKESDDFGNYSITERAYRKTGDFQIMVDNSFVDQLQILLAGFRAQPVLYLGSEQFSSTAIYGFYRGFDITIAYPTSSLCSINLEGLT